MTHVRPIDLTILSKYNSRLDWQDQYFSSPVNKLPR